MRVPMERPGPPKVDCSGHPMMRDTHFPVPKLNGGKIVVVVGGDSKKGGPDGQERDVESPYVSKGRFDAEKLLPTH